VLFFYYLQHCVILALKVDAPLKHSLVRPHTVLMVLARDKWRSKVQAHIDAGASSWIRAYTLNGFPINKSDFQVGDFWPRINRLKAADERFDCVFLDPPIYSATARGVVDLAQSYTRLINKVRPLIKHHGYLVAINNALFVSGATYLKEIESVCADGYLTIEELIPVPEDFIGGPRAQRAASVTDPAPFNHSTKIAMLKVRRKG
jgi:23S rRNA (cytosine1962-C5)-methyltransferase